MELGEDCIHRKLVNTSLFGYNNLVGSKLPLFAVASLKKYTFSY